MHAEVSGFLCRGIDRRFHCAYRVGTGIHCIFKCLCGCICQWVMVFLWVVTVMIMAQVTTGSGCADFKCLLWGRAVF